MDNRFKKEGIRKAYREESKKAMNVPDAKAIMDRNEKTFVSVMEMTMKIINTIKDSKDYEFRLVMCNTLSDQFKAFGFNIALAKLAELQSLVPKDAMGTAKAEYVDRAVG